MDYSYLVQKYDVPGPRYTSYPTVPFWESEKFSVAGYKRILNTISSDKDISIYIHLPFCESLCTYCGCTTRITKNHQHEYPYIEAVKKEWDLYCKEFNSTPQIKEIHLGGGTPTFFEPENLRDLIQYLIKGNTEFPEISLEGHPNSTTFQHLEVLKSLGANRLSLGIQDFNLEIQELINRKQTVDQVTEVVEFARKLNYKSINFDLIYGLPAQTIESVQNTMKEVVKLSPDRIAYYSYAHVPWIKKAQKSFEKLLPNGNEKRALYVEGKVLLKKAGYYEIGMDHFAKTNDDLYLAAQEGLMHRNFMGYTTKSTNISVSLGISAISDLWSAFAQNTKDLNEYYKLIDGQQLPVTKGHLLTPEDEVIRKHILNLMCKFTTEIHSVDLLLDVQNRLKEIEHDGMIEWDGKCLIVLDAGKPFIRNICMALDQRMIANSEKEIRFSQTV